ncbi:SUMF1/EgtB/PvdO family nonheme iron enzyme [Cryomorphaceae bacterium 1068]|nr:SUMF1/EgtB/PvdO family nonheme iron enzyme [Cryomorphaceae bacterium 1068]
MSESRQLAAIMFADIAGFSAMMQTDEKRALALRQKLKDKLESAIEKYDGKIVKWMGDGVICTFNSAVQSIHTAIDVQRAMLQDPVVPMRVGIHQADVIFHDGDVHGDGVNIASRLESFATIGSIFISSKVQDDLKSQSDIETVSLGKYLLKNMEEPVEIFAVSNEGLVVPANKKLEGKGIKYVSDKISIKKRTLLLRIAIVLAILAVSGYFLIPPYLNKLNARNTLLPAIQKIAEDNFYVPTSGFDMAIEAEKYIAEDSALIKLWPRLATTISIETVPSGAEVFWKDYDKPDDEWRSAGSTPLEDLKLPRGYLRMEFRKDGYQTVEYAGPWAKSIGPQIDTVKLDALESLPKDMARIPDNEARMYIVGLEQTGGNEIEEFLMDKFEVTNKEFKEFVDAGGYADTSFWKHPFYAKGVEYTADEAMATFIDKTNQPGPANWEAGTYPDGMESHPVTGISWYEAAAYAVFAKKKLPTIYHWSVVAHTNRTQYIVPLSNFNGKSTVPVGSLSGYSAFGVYDLAGNAREWCMNGSDIKGQNYILGGGWNDPTYAFNDSYTQSAMDRSVANGFRCMKLLEGETAVSQLTADVAPLFRDYSLEKPVDDKTFALILNQFIYDKTPLNPTIEQTINGEGWKAEKIVYDAGYNNEEMEAWLYLPEKAEGPYQPIVFFPGSNGIYSTQYDPEYAPRLMSFVMKSGRALVVPIFKGTHDRHDDLKSDLPDETVFYKDHLIMWGKEVQRTIDYLETRSDIQADKIGYLGWSWGGYMGGIMPAIDKRIKASVLNVGGMVMNKSLPEADQLNYLPRVTQPTLMLNGKHDMFFPAETSQKPMFEFLGTPDAHKKRIVYEAGHLVPRVGFMKESLAWYDRYLGEVK